MESTTRKQKERWQLESHNDPTEMNTSMMMAYHNGGLDSSPMYHVWRYTSPVNGLLLLSHECGILLRILLLLLDAAPARPALLRHSAAPGRRSGGSSLGWRRRHGLPAVAHLLHRDALDVDQGARNRGARRVLNKERIVFQQNTLQ